MKTCSGCIQIKPIEQFYIGRGKCKACLAAQHAKYHANHTDRVRENAAKNYAKNREKRMAYIAAWQAANPEKHLYSHRISEQNRRSRTRASGGKLSSGLSAKLFSLQRGKCACGCGQNLGDDYHLDHRMPLSLGGVNEDWNMQLLRSTCNLRKHAKHPIDFMQSKGFLL